MRLMAIMAANTEQEICPLCGEFADSLNDFTGWCFNCSPATTTTSYSDSRLSPAEIFLLRNADHIEHYLFRGKTVNQAIDLLKDELAKYRTCICCGGFIKGGGANPVICRRTKKCRSASRRYIYLYTGKGLTKPEALAQILQELNGSE